MCVCTCTHTHTHTHTHTRADSRQESADLVVNPNKPIVVNPNKPIVVWCLLPLHKLKLAPCLTTHTHTHTRTCTHTLVGWYGCQLWQPPLQRLPPQDGRWNFDLCCWSHGPEDPHTQLHDVILEELQEKNSVRWQLTNYCQPKPEPELSQKWNLY